MKRIMVAVDFSDISVFAVDVAAHVANSLKTKLRLVHVRTGKQYFPEFAKNDPQFSIEDNDVSYMEFLVNRAKRIYKVESGEVDYKFRQGNVVKEITNQAHYDDSIVIICGTHGVSGFEDRWIGSNAYRLVSSAPCPVIAIRKEISFDVRQKILIPIDYERVSRRIVPHVAGFAKAINAQILVVGVGQKKRWVIPGQLSAFVHQVDRFLRRKNFMEYETAMIDGTEGPRQLLDFAKAHDVTMIALPVRKTGNPFTTVFFPFANELLNMSDLPVIAVPEYDSQGLVLYK